MFACRKIEFHLAEPALRSTEQRHGSRLQSPWEASLLAMIQDKTAIPLVLGVVQAQPLPQRNRQCNLRNAAARGLLTGADRHPLPMLLALAGPVVVQPDLAALGEKRRDAADTQLGGLWPSG